MMGIGLLGLSFTLSCTNPQSQEQKKPATEQKQEFKVLTEQFSDLRILRYQVPGFNELSLNQKKLLYYLYEAALAGRDMFWDQNYKYNLAIRKTLETIIKSQQGQAPAEGEWGKFMEYTKRVWFSNGIHHHYSYDKILPEFSKEYFAELLKKADANQLPLQKGESMEAFTTRMTSLIFDPKSQPLI